MDAGTLEHLDLAEGARFAPDAGDLRPDAHALGRLIGGVRDMIEAARAQSLSLQSTIEQASALDGDIAAASRQLHERLSLSARMLKAFQSQIDRIETLLERSRDDEERAHALEQRMQSRLAEFETRLERYLERFDARLEEMTARASKRFKAEVAKHESALRSAAESMPGIEAGVSQLAQQLAGAESRWTIAQGSLRESIEDAHEAQSELRADAERTIEIAAALDEQSQALIQDLEDEARAAATAARDLETRSARAHSLLPSLADLEQVRARVANLLQRLEPVLPILHEEEAEVEARLREAAGFIRAGLSRELRQFAAAFHRLADRSIADPAEADAMPPVRKAPAPCVEIFLPEPCGAD